MSLVIVEQCLMEGSSEDADASATAMATVRGLRLLLNALKPLVGSSAACALCRRSVLVATSLIPRALADGQTSLSCWLQYTATLRCYLPLGRNGKAALC